MARNDEPFVRLEVEFMRSPDFLDLSPEIRCLYLSLWCYSRTKLRAKFKRPSDDYLRNIAGLANKPITKYLETLEKVGLILLEPEYITMIGIHEKHKRLHWKDAPYRNDINPLISPIREKKGREDKKRGDKKRKKSKKEKEVLNDGWKKDEKFMEFWESYPSAPKGRSNPTATYKKWNSLVANGVNPDDLIRAAKHYSQDSKRLRGDEDYTRGSQVFLGPDAWWKVYQEPPEPEVDYTDPSTYSPY